MTFDKAVDFILQVEGGSKIVDDPQDPGGLTKWGISLAAYPDLGPSGIRRLTKAEAKAIYKRDYWIQASAPKLPSILRLPVFDCAVNQGVNRSSKILQTACNLIGSRLVVDGKIGPKTMEAIKNHDSSYLAAVFMQERIRIYRSLSGWDRFGKGWERRVLLCAITAGK